MKVHSFFFFFFFFLHIVSSLRFWRPPTLFVHARSFWHFHNPPNSDLKLDYRIFNVHKCDLFACVLYTYDDDALFMLRCVQVLTTKGARAQGAVTVHQWSSVNWMIGWPLAPKAKKAVTTAAKSEGKLCPSTRCHLTLLGFQTCHHPSCCQPKTILWICPCWSGGSVCVVWVHYVRVHCVCVYWWFDFVSLLLLE